MSTDYPKTHAGTASTARWRWLKRLALVATGGICLLFVAWRAAIYLTERATPFSGTPLPTCGTMLDDRYTQAVVKARDHIQALMAERQIPGLAVAVAVDDKIVWSEGFGFADRDKQIQACPQTQFRIASVSKLLTAAAMAKLYEQGRLDLDAPIQKYVPSFPDKGHTITARQLASHRSGIRHYRDDNETLNTKHYNSVIESLEKFRDDSLRFIPDADFGYSSYGYILLSAVIEGAAGEDFLSYMRRQIFTPLEIHHTVAEHSPEPALNKSGFYDNVTPYSWDGKVIPSPDLDFSCKWASGGFLSTAEDLVRFGSALIKDGFLKPETRKLMLTPRTGIGGIVGYGLGWMTARDLHLRRVHFHFGAGSGGTAVLAIYPKPKVAFAILANLGHAKFPFARLMRIVNPFCNYSGLFRRQNHGSKLATSLGQNY
jgi:CubicO group peptidase (beta-lactamase class C family)